MYPCYIMLTATLASLRRCKNLNRFVVAPWKYSLAADGKKISEHLVEILAGGGCGQSQRDPIYAGEGINRAIIN